MKETIRKCNSCGQEIADIWNPEIIQREILSKREHWGYFAGGEELWLSDGRKARVVQINDGYEDVSTYYGEYPQGTVSQASIIISVENNTKTKTAYYKKVGTGDSYGDVNWNGPFREVKKTEKVIETFEDVEWGW